MVTKKELANALGLGLTRIKQLRRQGMPATSIDAALKWRNEHPPMRAATNGQNVGTIQITTEVQPKKRRKRVTFEPSGDALFDTLRAARLMLTEAFKLVAEAIAEDNIARLPVFVSIHNKAAMNCFAAERIYRQELERRRVLLPTQELIEIGRRTMGTVIRRLRRLAEESGPQCNPSDPLLAVNVLERSVTEIMLAAQRAIRDFNSLGKRA